MTNKAMAAEGIRVRFVEAALGKDAEGLAHSQNPATEEDLYRVSEATAEAFANMAAILDETVADLRDDGLDKTAFMLGGCFGMVLTVGLMAVVCML